MKNKLDTKLHGNKYAKLRRQKAKQLVLHGFSAKKNKNCRPAILTYGRDENLWKVSYGAIIKGRHLELYRYFSSEINMLIFLRGFVHGIYSKNPWHSYDDSLVRPDLWEEFKALDMEIENRGIYTWMYTSDEIIADIDRQLLK